METRTASQTVGEMALGRAEQVDQLVERVRERAADLAAKALGSGRWDYMNELGRIADALGLIATFPVACMDCKADYGRSTVSGSTGLCDACTEKR